MSPALHSAGAEGGGHGHGATGGDISPGLPVTCEDLVFRRGDRTVLDIPGLSFAEGRTTALLGPNGSGKSTLLRLVAGLERPSSGKVLVGGRAAAGDRATREHVAFAFQRPVFLTGGVGQNLSLGLRLRGLSRKEADRRAKEAAELCGVGHLWGRDAARLSGGEAQRANLARALALRAPVTLLDEPLAGLDAPARTALLNDLPGILHAVGGTAIVVTHDRDEALRLGDDMAVLLGGRVRARGTRAEVFGSPPDAETAAFLGYLLVPEDGGGRAGVAPGALRPGPGEVEFDLVVRRVQDVGAWVEVLGEVRGVPVTVTVPAGEAVGARMTVSASTRAVQRYRE